MLTQATIDTRRNITMALGTACAAIIAFTALVTLTWGRVAR